MPGNGITLTPIGGTPAGLGGFSPVLPNTSLIGIGVPIFSLNPTQIVGMIPLYGCNDNECRDFEGSCFINKVFGDVSATSSTYENDWSSFLLDFSMYKTASPVTITYTIQKLDPKTNIWSDVIILNSSAYGNYYPLNSIVGYPTYSGYQINWGKVLYAQGEGYYRFKMSSSFKIFTGCLVSPMFHLMAFECTRADRTAKFESWLTGKIGSIDVDYLIYDLCNLTWFDSVRLPGIFGHESTQYDEIMLEYQTGLMERVRDEAIQKFKWFSNLMPKYLHDRFKDYALMSDTLKVSDYNKNNSDYAVKQKPVIKAGGYDPQYHIKTRLSSVTVDFKEGVEQVIKTRCCEPARPPGT